MKKSTKIVTLVIAFALIFAAIGGTLAYLTDHDKAENVFTVGKVDIDLTETCEINNGKTGNDKVVYNDKVTTDNKGVTTFSNLMPGNTIVKTPVVTNTGDNKAYVRVVVTINNKEELYGAIDNYFKALGYNDEQMQQVYDDVFTGWGMNYTKDAENGEPTRLWLNSSKRSDDTSILKAIDMAAAVYDSYWSISKNNTFMTQTEKDSNGNISSNGGEYAYLGAWNQDVYYYKVLGGMNGDDWDSRCYVFYLELDKDESFTLFDGLNVPTYFDSENLAGFEGLKIGIYADAIQAEGFNTWTDAIDALEAQHPLGWWRDWSSVND